MHACYRDRVDAGRRLAAELREYADRPDVLILALPRGGVPVAFEVARALHLPLDVFVVRKLGLPHHPELAMGAIASGGIRVLHRDTIRRFGVTDAELAAATMAEERELDRRERQYRGSRTFPAVHGRTVILIDDGLATGATMTAAVSALRAQAPQKLVVAVPVAARETCAAIEELVDEIVCVVAPERFHSVGLWYEDFAQTTDAEVHELLEEAAHGPQPVAPRHAAAREHPVHVETDGVSLEGTLAVPSNAVGVVLFAHGSGSSRHSPRNRYVARELQNERFATLLLDLLAPDEEAVDLRTRRLRFDIALLARRLSGAIDWLGAQEDTGALDVGLFGASTGAAAALVAAAAHPERVHAVVSRGGRPDLAGDALPRVRAPTLLIVGGDDTPVIELNKRARASMHVLVELEIVDGATHLFEEPGALESVARRARRWFVRYLGSAAGGRAGSHPARHEPRDAGREAPGISL